MTLKGKDSYRPICANGNRQTQTPQFLQQHNWAPLLSRQLITIMSYLCQKYKQKKGGCHRLSFRNKARGNCPNFDKSVLVHTGPRLGLLRGQDVLRRKLVVLIKKSQNTYKGKRKVTLILSHELFVPPTSTFRKKKLKQNTQDIK